MDSHGATGPAEIKTTKDADSTFKISYVNSKPLCLLNISVDVFSVPRVSVRELYQNKSSYFFKWMDSHGATEPREKSKG